MKQGADWLAWALHFVAGVFVGGLIGFATVSRQSGWGLPFEQIFMFMCGTALLGAGLASFYGDQLWLRNFHEIIPPDDMKHSHLSRLISIVTGVVGSLLVLTVALRYFEVL